MWTRRRGRVHTRWRTEEREHLGNLVKNGKARSRVGDKPNRGGFTTGKGINRGQLISSLTNQGTSEGEN